MNREREPSGQYKEKATGDSILDVLEQSSEPVLTSKEVAENLGVSSETARRKLNQLHEIGEIERKDVGSRAVVWWKSE